MSPTNWLASRQAVAVAMVIALGSLGLGIYVEVAQIDLTRCLASYSDAASKATNARAAAADQLNRANGLGTQAEDDLWLAVNANQSLPPEEQKAKSTEAFQVFLAKRKQAQQMRVDAAKYRAEHPLPAPPSQRCG